MRTNGPTRRAIAALEDWGAHLRRSLIEALRINNPKWIEDPEGPPGGESAKP